MTTEHGVRKDDLRGLEKLGTDVLLTIEVTEEVDKAEAEKDWDNAYRAELEAVKKSEQLHRHNAEEWKNALFKIIPNLIPNLTINNTAMSNSNNANINSGDNSFINTGEMSVQGENISFGVISDQVNSSINQMPQSPDNVQLKEILQQFKVAIEKDNQLSIDDKTEALKQLEGLVNASQTDKLDVKGKLAKRSVQMLRGIATGLPNITNFVEACNKFLPMITKL
ncbi:MAG: hypothetical protein AAF572_29235 [Cyanobacteria bacterium P01_B01_bin.77]